MTDFQIITDSGCLGDMSFYNDNGIDIIPFQAIIDSKYLQNKILVNSVAYLGYISRILNVFQSYT